MILVTLGTQNNSFERLLKEVERCIENGCIKDSVIVQAGNTHYSSEKMKIYDFVDTSKMEEFFKEANFVITHGGVGSIIGALKENKKVIAIPRKKEYREHVNNHQEQIVNNFNESGYIIGVKDVSELQKAIKKIPSFEPKKYRSNTENFIKLIEEYIDKN